MEELVFDSLDLRTVSVQIAGKQYSLREASGEGARKYRNALLKATKLGPDGRPVSLDGLADAELVLVQETLLDQSGRRTPAQALAGWPARVIKAIFEKAQEISGLREVDDSEEGLVKREAALEKELGEIREKLARLRAPRHNGEAAEADPTALPHADSDPGSLSPSASA